MPPKSKSSSAVRNNMYKCTACNKSIKSTYEANLHPLIEVLVCRTCYTTYGTGDFAADFSDGVDENGDDNFCRWCCDGGDLFGCMNEDNNDRCHYSFCKECIERNNPSDEILTIDDEIEGKAKVKWYCYACDKNKLSKLRKNALEVLKDLNEKEQKRKVDDTIESPAASNKKRKQDTETEQTSTKVTQNGNSKPSKDTKEKEVQREVESTPVLPLVTLGKPLQPKPKPQPAIQSNASAKSQPHSSSKLPGSSTQPPSSQPKTSTPTHSRTQLTDLPPVQVASAPPKVQPVPNKTQNAPVKSLPKSQPSTPVPVQPAVNAPQPVVQPKPQQSVTFASSVGRAKLNGSTKSLTGFKERETLSLNSKLTTTSRANKRPLTAAELEQKLGILRAAKDLCLQEINTKFNNIYEILLSKEPKKRLADAEIEGLRKPFIDLQAMSNDLKKLNS